MIINNVISHPHPHCLVPVARDPKAYVPADETNIRNTWRRSLESDYETVQRQDWLEPGGFQ